MTVSIYTSRDLGNGKSRRRYEVALTDNLSISHTQVLPPQTVDNADDGTSSEAAYLASLKATEVSSYITDVENGIDPFLSNAKWNNRAELLKPILDLALSKPPTEPIVYNGLPFIDLVIDADLMAMYSQTQVWCDDLRTKAATLLASRATMESYVPALGGKQ